jgi:hypothetical protein
MIADDAASGRAWHDLTTRSATLRNHLEYLRDRGHPLPGDPELVAAAMAAMLGTLNYALPNADPDTVVDTLANLLLTGLTGPH